jgi:hypothetical protein
MPDVDTYPSNNARRIAWSRIWIGVVLLVTSGVVTYFWRSQITEAVPGWSDHYGFRISMPIALIVLAMGLAGVLSLIAGVSELRNLNRDRQE